MYNASGHCIHSFLIYMSFVHVCFCHVQITHKNNGQKRHIPIEVTVVIFQQNNPLHWDGFVAT